jgi:hypothetical protein
MQAEKLPIAFEFDSFDRIEFSPNIYYIQKRDSTNWCTKSPTSHASFSIKFPSSLLNTIEFSKIHLFLKFSYLKKKENMKLTINYS